MHRTKHRTGPYSEELTNYGEPCWAVFDFCPLLNKVYCSEDWVMFNSMLGNSTSLVPKQHNSGEYRVSVPPETE